MAHVPKLQTCVQNTPLLAIKHANLGGKGLGNGIAHPDYLRTNPLGLTRSARCFAQCFSLSALVILVDLLLARLTYRLACPLTYH